MVLIILAVVCALIVGFFGFLVYCDVSSKKMEKDKKVEKNQKK